MIVVLPIIILVLLAIASPFIIAIHFGKKSQAKKEAGRQELLAAIKNSK